MTATEDASSEQTEHIPQLSRRFVARRTSEGETGRLKEELKCQACGKGYKHVSSLAKHLWEHTPEWSVASKLLISKHQKVQLLEAASIIVSMNEEDKSDYSPEGFIKDDESPSSSPEERTESPPESPHPTIARRGSVSVTPVGTAVTTPRAIQKQSAKRRVSMSMGGSLSGSYGSYGSPAFSTLMSAAAAASPLPDTWLKEEDMVRRRRRSTLVRIPDHEDDELPERQSVREMLKEEEEEGEEGEVFEADL